MNRIIRNHLISLSNTLEETNSVIEQLLIKTDYDNVLSLLIECQNCAIEMGNQIEKTFGSELKIIHALEDYCEYLFLLASNLSDLSQIFTRFKKIHEQIQIIKKTLEEEIPYRKEIVFFPYKVSMWDSLESIYLAAKEDKDCDVYCVPIPYFDRNTDGTLGEMHYEGNDYPSNIEITNWETYDLEERRPDVVYIHNPYDNSNLVTCVHPQFFSSNLKKYTEKLIYIPYFVSKEINPDDQIAIEQMKNLIILPAVFNADEVILQSENIRQIYINEIYKVYEESGTKPDRKYLENKFKGTGSPKFDKIKNTKAEDLTIPSNWERIIQKPDKTRKIIIFYNTTIAALLASDERMIEKIKRVLQVFKENQEEVALLWRPHPLIETTIKAMRPKLWEEYSKIVEQYKKEAWGIYDDTPDMNKAIILSDAYYGDMSSVVQVYQKTGKLIMIQSVSVV